MALLNRKLVDVAAGACKRLMVFMPPQHGKSTLISHYFPSWKLGIWPHTRTILIGYEFEIAARWGRAVRDTLDECGSDLFGVSMVEDSKAAHRWDILDQQKRRAGYMVTAGIRGPITGRGADLMIIDDPVKNDQDALSQVKREANIEWWKSTARTRLAEDAAVVLVMTRWHERDLAGYLLEEDPDGWEVLSLPGIAEEDEDWDQWARKEGEPLAPEMFSLEHLQKTRSELGPYWWSAMYQQRPTPEEGGDFKREWFRYYQGWPARIVTNDGLEIPFESLRRFATMDLAASQKEHADFTTVFSWGLFPGKPWQLFLLDVVRRRMGGHEYIPAMRAAVEKHDLLFIGVEKAGMQLAIIDQARYDGVPVREIEADKDKRSRALAATPAFEGGQIHFPAGAPWLAKLEHEVLSFPRGEHDDQVDVIAYAVRMAKEVAAHGARPLKMKSKAGLRDPGPPEHLKRNQRLARRQVSERTARREELRGLMP